MANQWFIRRGSKITGPFDSAQLKSDAAVGQIRREDEISQSANGPWVAARKVKGLFAENHSERTAIPQNVPSPQNTDALPINSVLRKAGGISKILLSILLAVVFVAVYGFVAVPPRMELMRAKENEARILAKNNDADKADAATDEAELYEIKLLKSGIESMKKAINPYGSASDNNKINEKCRLDQNKIYDLEEQIEFHRLNKRDRSIRYNEAWQEYVRADADVKPTLVWGFVWAVAADVVVLLILVLWKFATK